MSANIKRIVETWDIQKRHDRSFTTADLREFVASMNTMTRRMIAEFGVSEPEFYESLAELATNAATLTTKGAKIIADGINRTDL